MRRSSETRQPLAKIGRKRHTQRKHNKENKLFVICHFALPPIDNKWFGVKLWQSHHPLRYQHPSIIMVVAVVVVTETFCGPTLSISLFVGWDLLCNVHPLIYHVSGSQIIQGREKYTNDTEMKKNCQKFLPLHVLSICRVCCCAEASPELWARKN